MKKTILSIFIGLSIVSHAQITKAETFLTGTKLSFYPNQCGNSIPEATGKLTFCDGLDNLGVVERSYGLNDRAVQRMFPNYFNNDEVYVTNYGLSIRNTAGSWENIPNIAVPTFNTQGDWTNAASISNGLVLPDGKMVIRSINGNIGPVTHVYDNVLKTIEPLSFPSNIFPSLFAYDVDRNFTWIIGFNSINRYLLSYDGNAVSFVANLPSIQGVDITVNLANLIYKDNHLYLGGINGLHTIDVSNYTMPPLTVTSYDSNTTPSLPFDRVNDLQFDTNDNLWLAQSSNNGLDGGIVKFDVVNETYSAYQLATNNPSFNYAFDNLAIDEIGTIWASASSYSGILELTFSGDDETWSLLSLEDLGNLNVPMTYRPGNIYFYNNQFYFTTIDFSSGNNNNYEVVINNDNVWSGRNDNEEGNLSYWMSSRFTNVLPDTIGGVWWFSSFDDIIMYRDADDNHQSLVLDNIGFSAVIDIDNKAIVRGGSPARLRKIDFPNATDIEEENNSAVDIKRAADKILIYSNNDQKVEVYENEALVNTYNLNDDWYNFSYHFAVDNNGLLWHFRYVSGLQIKSYNTNGGVITTYDRPESLSSLKKIVSGPNGVWFVGNLGALYYEAGVFYSFLAEDYDEIYKLEDAVVDTNGKIYLLNIDNASITTIENPTAANPIITNTSIENENSVLPALDHYRPDALTIDSEGSVWTHASLNAFKLIDNDFATEYFPEDNLNIREYSNSVLNLKITPNPTVDSVTIETNYSFKTIDVYSILGRKIMNVPFAINLNLEELQSGIYLLKFNGLNGSVTKKIIKE